MKSSRALAFAFLSIAWCAGIQDAIAQESGSRLGKLLNRAHDALTGQVSEVKKRAMDFYRDAPRAGSCADRRANILAMLPDALRFGRYDRDIYMNGRDDDLMKTGALSLDIGDGRTAYRDLDGQRYAEVQIDKAARQAVVIFRGTRVSVGSDIYTDVASHVGFNTAYYDWAASLVADVVRSHPGYKVLATGQSLGGGLAIYTVLRNPGVVGFAFNPAGLSLINWITTSAANKARVNAAVTVITTRNDVQIEPISALSFARRSVIPGHVFVIPSDEVNERVLHGPVAIVRALERLQSEQAGGAACEGDLGIIAR